MIQKDLEKNHHSFCFSYNVISMLLANCNGEKRKVIHRKRFLSKGPTIVYFFLHVYVLFVRVATLLDYQLDKYGWLLNNASIALAVNK